MNGLFRLKSFLSYFFTSKGINNMHSPFVYEFMQQVLYDPRTFYAYTEIENVRKELLQSHQALSFINYGAGSNSGLPVIKTISSILRKSSSTPKKAQLLFRIAGYYKCIKIIELGTNMGISAMYLASSGANTKVVTIEGAKELAEIARSNATTLGMQNIEILEDVFEDALPLALQKFGKTDLVYFDGNHRKEATLAYFYEVLPHLHEKSILIFDDIYWSAEMKEAWLEIRTNPSVTITIDLFYFGLVFFRKELSKQHFTLRW
ncbi:MAG: class I SAM-dependent methyltransferase [Chitinophagales bacterium]|nr:class I SAM-dependent methyltransferase [Chitinophagales bacterium]